LAANGRLSAFSKTSDEFKTARFQPSFGIIRLGARMRSTHSRFTEMASPQQILDDLVELFHADGVDPLVRYTSAVPLLKSLALLDMGRPEGLASLFRRRQSDLLAGFAIDCDLLPGSPTREHRDAFDQSVEWMRCYFDPSTDNALLLSHACTLAQDQPVHGKNSRGLGRFLRSS